MPNAHSSLKPQAELNQQAAQKGSMSRQICTNSSQRLTWNVIPETVQGTQGVNSSSNFSAKTEELSVHRRRVASIRTHI